MLAHSFVPRLVTFLVSVLVIAACATSPTGRRQLELFSGKEMVQMGDEAYKQIRKETPVSKDSGAKAYVACVTRNLTAGLPGPVDGGNWQVTVFKDEAINAFALPGGRIGVNTGLLSVVENQHQLATVIGHEMAHVQSQHPNARLSAQYATDTGVQLLAALAGRATDFNPNRVMALLGLGAQVGILLPFSRSQEQEADVLGLQYMARSGFDPRESIPLWRNMNEASKGRPPEFLSTHPSGKSRIRELQGEIPRAVKLYEQAQAQGRRPDCQRPGR